MTDARPLTDLLGDTRAQIAQRLQGAPASAAELADHVGVTPAAIRRHLGVLLGDDLVASETVRDGSMGRPTERWSLTRRGRRLFVDRSAEFADELLDHLEATYGRAALADFLRARAERHADRYAAALEGVEAPEARVAALASALTADGFAARVTGATGDGGTDTDVTDREAPRTLRLLQTHCAIQGIAEEHPEVCAHEAALFKRLLGTPGDTVKVSRRETIAAGADACVCTIDLPDLPSEADITTTPDTEDH